MDVSYKDKIVNNPAIFSKYVIVSSTKAHRGQGSSYFHCNFMYMKEG